MPLTKVPEIEQREHHEFLLLASPPQHQNKERNVKDILVILSPKLAAASQAQVQVQVEVQPLAPAIVDDA